MPAATCWEPSPLAPAHTYRIVDDKGVVHGVDPENNVQQAIANAHEDTEIFPLIHNYNILTGAVGSGHRHGAERSQCAGKHAAAAGQIPRRQSRLPRHLA